MSPEDWLLAHGYLTLSDAAVEYFTAVDQQRHIYVGHNRIDYGRRINCNRPGCKDLLGPNLLPGG